MRSRAPGWRIDLASLGRLAFRPNLLGVPGWKTGQAFLGRLAFAPDPFEAFGLGQLAKGGRPGPMVPTIIILLYLFYNFLGL